MKQFSLDICDTFGEVHLQKLCYIMADMALLILPS